MRNSYKTLLQEERDKTNQLREELESTRQELERVRDELERTRVIVDLAGIARHMGVNPNTPLQWRQRDLLPPVDFPEIRSPLWYATTIKEKFVVPTRRVWYDNPTGEPLPGQAVEGAE